jgi:uncharacterized protein YycO
MPALITLAQRRRFRGTARMYAHWSHAALVVSAEGTLIEAEGTGVRRSPLDKYHENEYHLVRMDGRIDDQQRSVAVRAAERWVGDSFGFLVMLELTIWLLTGLRLHRIRRDHQICSGLVARALALAGERFERGPAFTLPADLAEEYQVRP